MERSEKRFARIWCCIWCLTIPSGRFSLGRLMSVKRNARDLILDAAEAVVIECGAAHLTLDAVAARAKVSKGGLLYHFRSKDSLLEGMIQRCVQEFEAEAAETRKAFTRGAAAYLKAHLKTSCEGCGSARQVGAAMLAAVGNNPKLLRPVLAFYQALFDTLTKNHRNVPRAAIALLASKGLWLLETLNLSPLSARQRKDVVKEMLLLAGESA